MLANSGTDAVESPLFEQAGRMPPRDLLDDAELYHLCGNFSPAPLANWAS